MWNLLLEFSVIFFNVLFNILCVRKKGPVDRLTGMDSILTGSTGSLYLQWRIQKNPFMGGLSNMWPLERILFLKFFNVKKQQLILLYIYIAKLGGGGVPLATPRSATDLVNYESYLETSFSVNTLITFFNISCTGFSDMWRWQENRLAGHGTDVNARHFRGIRRNRKSREWWRLTIWWRHWRGKRSWSHVTVYAESRVCPHIRCNNRYVMTFALNIGFCSHWRHGLTSLPCPSTLC